MECRPLVEVAGVDRDAGLDEAPQQRDIAVKDARAHMGGSLRGRQIQPVSTRQASQQTHCATLL